MLFKQKAWQLIGGTTNLNGSIGGVYDTAENARHEVAPNELILIDRLRNGEMDAFAELVQEYQPLLYSLTVRIVRDEEEARDVTQETFLKIYRNFSRYRGESSLKTWICRIGINEALNSQRWWKRRKREELQSLDEPGTDERPALSNRLASTDASPEAKTLAHEQHAQLEHALQQLKPDFRLAVVMRDIEGLSYEEIASILAISVGTVKSRIARGRDALRTLMQQV